MLGRRLIWSFFIIFILASSLHAQFNLLHSFAGDPSDGKQPMGSLISNGSILYGMTELGGAYGAGTIFEMNADGTGYSILHSFIGGSSDGCNPYGSLLLIDSTLYGLTFKGGLGAGTLFKVYTNGTGFALLHSFSGDISDGYYPYGSLIAIGSTLYGMTYYGGTNGAGTIFKINTDGTGFSLIHSFAGGVSDGSNPSGSLISNGNVLYGMTEYGGTDNTGTIFKINADGTEFALLHSFSGTVIDGKQPNGDLLLSGSTLYGMTYIGGTNSAGVIFKINTNGTGFALLHSFNWPSDGYSPYGSLIEFNNILYGMTADGGIGVSDSTTGMIFQIDKNGTEYSVLHTFANNASDGKQPYGDLLLIGSKLYGMTSGGGAKKFGVVFSREILKTLNPPILIQPANNATGQPTTVTLKWRDKNSSPQELQYKVRLKLAGGAYAYQTLTANTVQYIKSGLAAGKKYYWNVQALANGTTIQNSAWANGGIDFCFTVQSQQSTLKIPILISPANNAINQPLSVTLRWNDTNSSLQELYYKVRLKLAGRAYTYQTLAANTVQYIKSGLTAGMQYYWSVQALGNGTTIKNSDWPADRKFTTTGSNPTIVYITATGTKYHKDGCRYLSAGKILKTLAWACANGYTPCSVCKPPACK